MRSVLITGASGLLGSNLAVSLRERFDVFGLYRNTLIDLEGCEMLHCDLLNDEELSDAVATVGPDLIIHCAAMASVDGCEADPVEAEAQIVQVSGNVARAAKGSGASLVAISTDSVYSGDEGPHRETGRSVMPLNVYGMAKLRAESEILNKHESALILRSNFFGWAPGERHSLGEWFLNGLRENKPICGFSDAFFTTIYTGEMVEPIIRALNLGISGVFNFGAREGVSKLEFGLLIADYFELDKGLISEARLVERDFDAPRGGDLRMNCEKFEKAVGYRLPTVEQSVFSFYKDSFKELEIKCKHSVPTDKVIPYGKHQVLQSDIMQVGAVLRSSLITQGPKVAEFEEAFAEMCGAKHAVACSNGTAALHLAMMAARIGPGDRVVTTPNTFLASANGAAYVGATPDFSDIDPVSYCLCPDALEENWQDDTRAVVAVDYAGQPAEMPRIADVARSRGAVLIEDACHAIGGRFFWEGKENRVGGHEWADMTTYSFHPVKTMTSAEGGMVVTNSDEYADRLRVIRTHGMIRDPKKFVLFNTDGFTVNETPVGQLYEMQELGYNYRMSDVHAALGVSQLGRLPSFIRNRSTLVSRYNEAFGELEGIVTPKLARWLSLQKEKHSISWHLYPIRFDFSRISVSRSELLSAFKSRGVSLQVHYLPVHLQPYYVREYGYGAGKCPEAEEFGNECVSLPLFNDPSIASKVIEVVKEVLEDILV